MCWCYGLQTRGQVSAPDNSDLITTGSNPLALSYQFHQIWTPNQNKQNSKILKNKNPIKYDEYVLYIKIFGLSILRRTKWDHWYTVVVPALHLVCSFKFKVSRYQGTVCSHNRKC